MQKYNLDQAQVDLSRNQPAYALFVYAGWFLDRSTCAWSRLYFCINAVARCAASAASFGLLDFASASNPRIFSMICSWLYIVFVMLCARFLFIRFRLFRAVEPFEQLVEQVRDFAAGQRRNR